MPSEYHRCPVSQTMWFHHRLVTCRPQPDDYWQTWVAWELRYDTNRLRLFVYGCGTFSVVAEQKRFRSYAAASRAGDAWMDACIAAGRWVDPRPFMVEGVGG